MSYWGKPCTLCVLCGKKFSRKHLFTECETVEEWEYQVFGYDLKTSDIRIESMFENNSQYHTLSWIYNWCIWKNYWDIFHSKFENCFMVEEQISNFRKYVKFNEYLHLKYSIGTSTKMQIVEMETNIFHFYSIRYL